MLSRIPRLYNEVGGSQMKQTKIKSALDFYILANQLKYIEHYTPQLIGEPLQSKETYASHIYGSLILAIALNSEFQITTNIGKVIRMITLTYFETLDNDPLHQSLRNLAKGQKFYEDMQEQNAVSTTEATLAQEALALDTCLNSHYQMNPNITPEELYFKVIWNNPYFQANPEDYDKYIEVLRFYLLNQTLKQKERSGWDKTHWNIKTSHIERISEHVFGTISLALALDSEFDFNINIDEVLETLTLHEIGEILIGDITPFDNITPEQKAEIEHKAMSNVLGNLNCKNRVLNLLCSFDAKSTKNAEFALWCDKLEADLQSKIYQEKKLHRPLNDNPNNIVLKSPKVEQMIKDGATTAFDIWYEWDKDKFTESPTFVKTLRYIKENRLIN